MIYEAVVTREERMWLADVPALPGAHTYAPTLEALRQGLREVVVLCADLADDAQPDIRLCPPSESDAADCEFCAGILAERAGEPVTANPYPAPADEREPEDAHNLWRWGYLSEAHEVR